MKLSPKDFETLQDGLDALLETGNTGNMTAKEQKALLKRIREAEDAIVAIGTY